MAFSDKCYFRETVAVETSPVLVSRIAVAMRPSGAATVGAFFGGMEEIWEFKQRDGYLTV